MDRFIASMFVALPLSVAAAVVAGAAAVLPVLVPQADSPAMRNAAAEVTAAVRVGIRMTDPSQE
jgi:hypothetical protein